VQKVQQALRRLGAALADRPGHFGLWTEAAIYLLQRSAGLSPDGVVGPDTAARLDDPTPPAGFAEAPELLTLLEVPYLSQRDNVHRPLATCNVTSLAMALRYYDIGPEHRGKQLEDELYELLHSPAGLAYYAAQSPELYARGVPPEEVYDNLVWATGRRGLLSSFSESRQLSDIESEVAAGRPVMLSGRFTGSGHIVVLVGLCRSGDFIVHDPFGDWNHQYQPGSHGQARIYGRERTLSILKDLARPEKWALFFDPDGKP